MIFVSEKDAKHIVELADTSKSFGELERKIFAEYRRLFVPIMMALKKLYIEERVSLPRSIVDSWKKFSGDFIPLSDLDSMVDEFCRDTGVSKETFLAWFNGETRLSRRTQFSSRDLEGLINYFIVRRIFRRAKRIVFLLAKIPVGGFIKDICFILRNIGYMVYVEGSKVIVEAADRSLDKLASIAGYAEEIVVSTLKNKTLRISNVSISVRLLHKVYDSKLEEVFAECLDKLGASFKREPIFFVGDKIFIADFEIEFGGSKGIVEIIGYWRKNYLIEKEIKVRHMARLTKNLFLVIDEKHRDVFRHIKAEKFYFRSKKSLCRIAKKILDRLESKPS